MNEINGQAKSDKLVILAEKVHPEFREWLSERVNLVECGQDSNELHFNKYLIKAHGLIVRTYTSVDRALLERSPNLMVVGRAGVGVDNIDLDMCREQGVTVVHTPNANTQAVIEFVLANILDAIHPRKFINEVYDLGDWINIRNRYTAKLQLDELTIGILGMGRIGKCLARVLVPLGSTLIYHDLLEIAAENCSGAQPVDFDTLIRGSDVLTVHVDGRLANTDLIDADTLSKMKPGVSLINTSRGYVVNPLALSQFLIANPDAQAWIDVHEPEPFLSTYPLLNLSNAHISPHIAGKTATADKNMSRVVYDVWKVLQGKKPEFPVS